MGHLLRYLLIVKGTSKFFLYFHFCVKDSNNQYCNKFVAYRPYMYFNQLGNQDSGPLKIRLTRALYILSYNHTLCKDLLEKVTRCSLVPEILLKYRRESQVTLGCQQLGPPFQYTNKPDLNNIISKIHLHLYFSHFCGNKFCQFIHRRPKLTLRGKGVM